MAQAAALAPQQRLQEVMEILPTAFPVSFAFDADASLPVSSDELSLFFVFQIYTTMHFFPQESPLEIDIQCPECPGLWLC